MLIDGHELRFGFTPRAGGPAVPARDTGSGASGRGGGCGHNPTALDPCHQPIIALVPTCTGRPPLILAFDLGL